MKIYSEILDFSEAINKCQEIGIEPYPIKSIEIKFWDDKSRKILEDCHKDLVSSWISIKQKS